MTQEQQNAAVVIGGAVIIVVIIVVMLWYGFRQKGEPSVYVAPTPPEQIARLEEITVFTGLGIVALILLILHQAAMVIWMTVARSAVQEASVGTVWIAGNVLLCTLLVVGRRGTYRVLRDPAPSVPPRA
jgi:hypothetical protein